MRNASTIFLLLFLATNALWAQNLKRKAPLDRSAMSLVPDYSIDQHVRRGVSGTIPGNSSKRSGVQVFTQPLGTASNIYTCVRPEQNQVSVHNPSGRITFIHRQNIGTWGGVNGTLRYDCSSDRGQSWNLDIGPLNPLLTRVARYPSMAIYTDPGSGDQSLLYTGATLDPNAGWDGHVNGMICDACSTNTTEHYDFIGDDTYIPSSLTEGLSGEFWMADIAWDHPNTSILDTIFLYKTTMANCDVDWQRVEKFETKWNSSSTGVKIGLGPQVAFSPDGMVGYVVAMGDIEGGIDSIYTPIVYKTVDGGANWTGPTEVDLSGSQMIIDSLQSLWGQQGNPPYNELPVSSGQYTCTWDFDITVDVNGNLHIFNQIASARSLDADSLVEPAAYSIYFGFAKLFVDIHTTDQGATWDARYIAPGMAFQGSFGAQNAFTMENYCQMSRDATGERVFYSWVDMDTAGLFGTADLLLPNLRIAATRITDGYQTCWKMITDGDFAWEGAMLAPTMAPTIVDYGTTKALPIVGAQLVNNDPLQETAFHYFGDAALIFESEFQDPANLNLAFDVIASNGGCNIVGVDDRPLPTELLRVEEVWPNPTSNELNIRYTLGEYAHVEAAIYDLHGKKVSAIFEGEQGPGLLSIQGNPALSLPAGLYIIKMEATTPEGQSSAFSRRTVIGH